MDKILSLLGLCKKSGRLISGTDMVIDAMQKNKVYFIFIASDATYQTQDKMEKKAYFYQVPINKSFDTLALNSAIGEKNIKVVGITDQGFADSFMEKLKDQK